MGHRNTSADESSASELGAPKAYDRQLQPLVQDLKREVIEVDLQVDL
jgi:hypothetical protein